MSPAFRPRLTRRKEPSFPTIRAVLEEDPRRIRRSSIDLRPSHVFTVRHHPYGHQSNWNEATDYGNEDLEDIDGVLIYGIQSSFLIPDWIFDDADNNGITFEQSVTEPTPLYVELPTLQKEHAWKTALSKTFAFARRLFSNNTVPQF